MSEATHDFTPTLEELKRLCDGQPVGVDTVQDPPVVDPSSSLQEFCFSFTKWGCALDELSPLLKNAWYTREHTSSAQTTMMNASRHTICKLVAVLRANEKILNDRVPYVRDEDVDMFWQAPTVRNVIFTTFETLARDPASHLASSAWIHIELLERIEGKTVKRLKRLRFEYDCWMARYREHHKK